MKVEFVGVTAPDSIILTKFPALIGRDPEADVCLADASLGNYQCMVDRVGRGLVVWDLGVGSGTFVNGVRVTKAPLLPGDHLTLGGATFTVHYQQSGRPALA